jgi:hypothetical protein
MQGRRDEAGGFELLVRERSRVPADLIAPPHRRLVDLRDQPAAATALVEQRLLPLPGRADPHPWLQLGDLLQVACAFDLVEALHRSRTLNSRPCKNRHA